MKNRVLFSTLSLLTLSITTARCGPLSPSISKLGKSDSSKGILSFATVEPTPAIRWEKDLEVIQTLENDDFYIINSEEQNESADLLENLNETGEAVLPVEHEKISKIEICCTSDEKVDSTYKVSVKPIENSDESLLEIKIKKDSISKAHRTELKQVKVRIKRN